MGYSTGLPFQVKVLAGSVALFLVILWLAPLAPIVDPSRSAVLFLSINLAAFLVGSLFPGVLPIPRRLRSFGRVEVKVEAWVAVGVAGVLLRLFDRVVVRGIGLLGGIEGRLAAEDSASILSAISAVLTAAGMVPLLAIIYGRARMSAAMRLTSWGLFAYPALEALGSAGRNVLVLHFLVLVFAIVDSGRLSAAKLRALVGGALAVTALGMLLIGVFVWRLSDQERNLAEVAFNSVYAYTVPPTPYVSAIVASTDAGSVSGLIVLGALHLAQYALHGWYEFALMMNEFIANTPHALGEVEFFPLFKLFAMLGLGSTHAEMPPGLVPRPAVFTTYLGPAWVDFGWFAPTSTLVLAALLEKARRSSQLRGWSSKPVFLVGVTIVALSPFASFLQNGQGVYYLVSLSIFATTFVLRPDRATPESNLPQNVS